MGEEGRRRMDERGWRRRGGEWGGGGGGGGGRERKGGGAGEGEEGALVSEISRKCAVITHKDIDSIPKPPSLVYWE